MTAIRLEINTVDVKIVDICQDYWGLDDMGNFKIKVQNIAIKYGMDMLDILPLVKSNSIAFSTSIQCEKCQLPYQFGHRGHVKYPKSYIGEHWRCEACGGARPKKTIEKPKSPQEKPKPPQEINNIRALTLCVIEKLTENYHAALKQNLPLHETSYGRPTGNLLVIAARGPGNNNQFIGLDIGIRLALDEGIPILLIYASGSGERFIERILCEESRIDPFRLRNGVLGTRDWIALMTLRSQLSTAPITIVKLDNPISSDPAVTIAAWRRNNYYLPS